MQKKDGSNKNEQLSGQWLKDIKRNRKISNDNQD